MLDIQTEALKKIGRAHVQGLKASGCDALLFAGSLQSRLQSRHYEGAQGDHHGPNDLRTGC
jgi:glucose-6-phosphate dehydrogenase assembly protein OpcA